VEAFFRSRQPYVWMIAANASNSGLSSAREITVGHALRASADQVAPHAVAALSFVTSLDLRMDIGEFCRHLLGHLPKDPAAHRNARLRS
jgi:hypothetical protein